MNQKEEKNIDDLRNLHRDIKQLMENKKFLEAEKFVNEGVVLLKNNTESMFFASMYKFLCKLHNVKMEYEKAIDGAEFFLKNKEAPSIIDLDFYIIIGKAHEKLENYGEALKSYNDYLEAYRLYKKGNLERNISIVDNVDSITMLQYNFTLLTMANCAFMEEENKDVIPFLQKVDFDLIEMELLSPFILNVFSCGHSKKNFDFVYMLYEKFQSFENPYYMYAFINLGEEKLRENPESMVNYTQSFKDSELNNEYVKLQKLRYLDLNGEEDKALEFYKQIMSELEICSYPYTDLLYYGVKYNQNIEIFYEHMEFIGIDSICLDIGLKHEAFYETLINYLMRNKEKEISIKTAFMLSLLLESGLIIANADKETTGVILDFFAKTTSICINGIFKETVLNEENCFLLPRGYRFAYYTGKAFEKKGNKANLNKYLLKAKECYPEMEKAIKLLT